MHKPRTNYYKHHHPRRVYRSHQPTGSDFTDRLIIVGIIAFIALVLWVASQDAQMMAVFLAK